MFMCFVSLFGGWQPTLLEDEWRAQILVLLGRSTTWPERPGLDPQRPFIIGVLGPYSFEDHLKGLVRGLVIRNRPVKVNSIRRLDPAALTECDILYISDNEEERLSPILKILKGAPVLVVGGKTGYAFRGVMLNFPNKNGVIAPEVNLKALREARLEIHPAFLAKAKVQVVE